MADRHEDAHGVGPGSEALYRWWLQSWPALFRGAAGERPEDPPAAAPPFPADQTTEALKRARQWIGALCDGYLRTLVASQPGEPAHGFEAFVADQVAGMSDRLVAFGQAFSGHPNLAELNARLTGAPLTALGEALRPLSLNLERAYGGLADAFGFGPARALEEAGRDLALAMAAQRQAQIEYVELVAGALQQGAEKLTVRLAEIGQRGESIDTLLALIRLWARTTDQAMHEAMQAPRALEAAAKLLRATARARAEQQRVVAIASEALNVPTRAEVDEAFREIQQLKRELRKLRKPGGDAAAPAPVPPAAAPVRRTRRRRVDAG